MSEFSEGMVEAVKVFNRPLTSGEVCVLYSQDPSEWRWKISHDGGEGYQAASVVHGPAVPDWEIAVVPAILLEEAQAALAAAPDYRPVLEAIAVVPNEPWSGTPYDAANKMRKLAEAALHVGGV